MGSRLQASLPFGHSAFPTAQRGDVCFEGCHLGHGNASPATPSREHMVMNSTETRAAVIKCNCLPFHTHTPRPCSRRIPARAGLPFCNFIATESPAPEMLEPHRCLNEMCAEFSSRYLKQRQAALPLRLIRGGGLPLRNRGRLGIMVLVHFSKVLSSRTSPDFFFGRSANVDSIFLSTLNTSVSRARVKNQCIVLLS